MTREIPVSYRGSVAAIALVSDEDFDDLNRYKWNLSSDGYARRSRTIWCKETKTRLGVETVWMHRAVMGLKAGDPREVDHEDLDRLNNQRENLSVVSKTENLKNIQRRARERLEAWRTEHIGAQMTLDGRITDDLKND